MALEYYYVGEDEVSHKMRLTVGALCNGRRTMEEVRTELEQTIGFNPLNPVPESKLDYFLSVERPSRITVVVKYDDGTVALT